MPDVEFFIRVDSRVIKLAYLHSRERNYAEGFLKVTQRCAIEVESYYFSMTF